jgi:Spy/CpxP family protein refolding chaperone
MKTSRWKILVVAISVVTLLAAIGFSQTAATTPGPGHRGRHFGRMLGISARYLELTDAQKTQMKDIMTKEKPTIQPLMQQLAQNRQQMRQLESAATFDENKVRALATQQSQTMAELIVQKARIKSELMQVLTPEQKTKMAAFEARREARFQKHFRQGQAAPNEATPNQ